MPRPVSRWRHALAPAIGVVLGVIVGVLINVVTSGGPTGAVVGLVVAALAWAGWEAWHAVPRQSAGTSGATPGSRLATDSGTPPQRDTVQVTIAAARVEGSQVTGVRGLPGATDISVNMAIGMVGDSSLIGIDVAETSATQVRDCPPSVTTSAESDQIEPTR